MSNPIEQRLRGFYQTLRDKPLEPGDPFYEPFLEEGVSEHDADPIAELKTSIEWNEAASVHLLSGKRGNGKSTELRRLRQSLKAIGCEVFLCDMQDFIHLTKPIEISDFLVSLMTALHGAYEHMFGESLSQEGYWSRFIHFLKSDVKFESASVDLGVEEFKTSLGLSLKNDPTFKKKLQEQLRGHVAQLVQQVHGFSNEVVGKVRERSEDPNKKVVLLVDSLEQIRGVGDEAESVYKSVENLFSGFPDALHFPQLHLVYTVPPYLSTLAPGFGRLLGGGTVRTLPSVHVRTRGGETDPSGVDTMKRILSRRYANWNDIFTDAQVTRMCTVTGGDIREFLRLVAECLTKAAATRIRSLPIPDSSVEQAINHLKRDMLPIAADDAKWLHQIAKSKGPCLESNSDLPRLARFFDHRLVLNYRNGDDWYDVHPLILDEVIEG